MDLPFLTKFWNFQIKNLERKIDISTFLSCLMFSDLVLAYLSQVWYTFTFKKILHGKPLQNTNSVYGIYFMKKGHECQMCHKYANTKYLNILRYLNMSWQIYSCVKLLVRIFGNKYIHTFICWFFFFSFLHCKSFKYKYLLFIEATHIFGYQFVQEQIFFTNF